MKRKPNYDPSPDPFSLFLPFSPRPSPPPLNIHWNFTHTEVIFFFFFWEKSDPDESIFQTRGGYKIFIPGKHRSFLVFLLYIPRDQGPCFPLRGEGRGGEGRDKYARTGIHASGAFPFRFLSRFSFLTRASIYSRILNPLVLPPPISLPWTSREGGDAGGRW